MDSPELIRNITLCGHLHHGKVRPNLLIAVIVLINGLYFYSPVYSELIN
jgi:hypothetical protein